MTVRLRERTIGLLKELEAPQLARHLTGVDEDSGAPTPTMEPVIRPRDVHPRWFSFWLRRRPDDALPPSPIPDDPLREPFLQSLMRLGADLSTPWQATGLHAREEGERRARALSEQSGVDSLHGPLAAFPERDPAEVMAVMALPPLGPGGHPAAVHLAFDPVLVMAIAPGPTDS